MVLVKSKRFLSVGMHIFWPKTVYTPRRLFTENLNSIDSEFQRRYRIKENRPTDCQPIARKEELSCYKSHPKGLLDAKRRYWLP